MNSLLCNTMVGSLRSLLWQTEFAKVKTFGAFHATIEVFNTEWPAAQSSPCPSAYKLAGASTGNKSLGFAEF